MNLTQIFAENLRIQMLERAITQRDLAFRSGVSQAHISLLLKGKRGVTLAMVESLAMALEMNPSELLVSP